MNWEETVIEVNHLIWTEDGELIDSNYSHIGRAIAKAQAKASYEAGEKAMYEKIKAYYDANMKEHERVGIRKVMKWIGNYYSGIYISGMNQYLIPRREREAQLKEWGIE